MANNASTGSDQPHGLSAEHAAETVPHEPMLPPRSTPAEADLWQGVEREPDLHLLHLDITPRRPGVFLLPTRAARLLVVIGSIGLVIATMMLVTALMPAFETGASRGFIIPLDEHPLFGGTLIVSSIVVYLGWFWWTLSASFNAERIIPLATSPWLPTFVYLGGPIVALVGADLTSAMGPVVMWGGIVWFAAGHVLVVASFRATAVRIGASREDFSKMMWVPLAWVSYRMGLVTLLSFFDEQDALAWFLIVVAWLSVLFPVSLVMASWNAMSSFERACRRLNLRTLGEGMTVRELLKERTAAR